MCNKNMQNYAVKNAKYAEVHILHILHIYALPTLLMEASNSIKPKIMIAAPMQFEMRKQAVEAQLKLYNSKMI